MRVHNYSLIRAEHQKIFQAGVLRWRGRLLVSESGRRRRRRRGASVSGVVFSLSEWLAGRRGAKRDCRRRPLALSFARSLARRWPPSLSPRAPDFSQASNLTQIAHARKAPPRRRRRVRQVKSLCRSPDSATRILEFSETHGIKVSVVRRKLSRCKMLTSSSNASNQYLRPEYLTPLPTTVSFPRFSQPGKFEIVPN
jgi:hypothetical protein